MRASWRTPGPQQEGDGGDGDEQDGQQPTATGDDRVPTPRAVARVAGNVQRSEGARPPPCALGRKRALGPLDLQAQVGGVGPHGAAPT